MLLISGRLRIVLLLMCLYSFHIECQELTRTILKQNMAVAGYSSDFELSPKLSLSAEIQERINLVPYRQSQMFVKSQVSYELLKDFTLANGLAYYLNTPIDAGLSKSFKVPEIRLNHDFRYNHDLGSVELGHRIRMEERFIRKRSGDSLLSGSRFVERISYLLSLEYKLRDSKSHDLYLKLSDGIYMNAGKWLAHNAFDQNRFYAGLNYQLLRNLTVELGYINLYQQRISHVEYLNRNIASLAISHTVKMYH